jgi:hypothetical protein
MDIAIVEENGRLIMHRIDCPVVRKQAADGMPVLSMFDCENNAQLDKYPKHDCLKDKI